MTLYNPSQSQSPTITLPLRTFLSFMWGSKQFSLISRTDYQYILNSTSHLSFHEQEQYFHVITEEERKLRFLSKEREVIPIFSSNLVEIWNPADWATEYARWKKLKSDSDRDRAAFDRRKATITELTQQIAEKLGMRDAAGLEIAGNIATELVHKQNKAAAEHFGIKLQEDNLGNITIIK